MGLVKRDQREYLLLIEECSLMGQILKSNVFRVDQIIAIPLQHEANQADLEHVALIESLVKDKSFYFSYNYNLTNSLQTNVNNLIKTDEEESKGLQKKGGSDVFWGNYDTDLVFNRSLCAEWNSSTTEQLWSFIVPLMYGYVYIHALHFDNNKAEFVLISRKDCNRLGRRFVSRGLDEKGNSSNFIESEHIIVHYEEDTYRVASHIQIRGSIPLLWTQTPTLKYAPKLEINEDESKSKSAAQKHFDTKIKKYGKHVLINLIDKKGSQLKIGEAFTKLVQDLGNDQLFYEWFDFHGECAGMKYENLSILIEHISEEVEKQDYFMAKLDYAFDQKEKLGRSTCMVMLNQNGACKTNCMDSLDRTNVVQSVLSRLIAHRQLWKMNILKKPKGDPFEKFPVKFEELFRQAWTYNANACSILYSGTPALKTDFTLTGKRTVQGALQDGIHSAQRYYINNFCDFYNQDVLDSSLNKLDAGSDLRAKGLPKFLIVLSSLILGFVILNTAAKYMLGIHSMAPEEEGYYDNGYIVRFIHLVIMFGTTGFVVKTLFLK
jgi:hypothetical protein